MKFHLIAAVAAIAIVSQASAPAFAAQGGLAAPTATSRAKVNCNSAPSCNQLISKCNERHGNWNPGGYNKQGQPIKGNCTGL